MLGQIPNVMLCTICYLTTAGTTCRMVYNSTLAISASKCLVCRY